ncbi:LacI family DNA-binding transcriptional regulator [Aureimonas pseudogalii]|uniref:LacI family transcriptional regulator n=1 Tax=Aureimonas pseudogalii TaxID=1744844 RepID=A0A7W6ECV8_9HYPH|nr:LacI family DNA-binding transcriptional regulator [Aureimonas pseudogalii]MBB3996972.1 LacI family transcriptional regulator [Aureimonas pseudogalii]
MSASLGAPQGVPTLTDVARVAGVSLATADRVVNRRAGVRPATIARVEAAVAALGFERHAGAADLARRVRHRVTAVLPSGGNPFMRRLGEELSRAARLLGARRLDLTLAAAETLRPTRLAEAIEAAAGLSDAVVAVGLDDPLVAAAIDAAAARGVPVITLVSDVPGSRRSRYVGIDNRAAGRVAGSLVGRFLGPEPAEVAVLLGSRALRDHRDRLDGFAAVLGERFPHLRLAGVWEGEDDPVRARAAVAELLAAHPRIAAVYSAGAGNVGLARALEDAGSQACVVAHELTAETRPLIERGAVDALIAQDAGHEARSALRLALAQLSGTRIDESQERIRIEILLRDNLPEA